MTGLLIAGLFVVTGWGMNIDMKYTRLYASIRESEGKNLNAYRDTRGIWTIGYGHNMETDPTFQDAVTQLQTRPQATYSISDGQADTMLRDDLAKAMVGARRLFPGFDNFTDQQQESLVEMVYQLGVTGVKQFENMCTAINQDPPAWPVAAVEALDSAWYRDQTPQRALKVARGFIADLV